MAWIVSLLTMFQITHNTVRYFSLAEILLMAAMNQAEAARGQGVGLEERNIINSQLRLKQSYALFHLDLLGNTLVTV